MSAFTAATQCFVRGLSWHQAALTAARSAANAVYTPPLTQAALDMQSGILHAEEKDFKTAFSYFFETLEGYSAQDDPRAVLALKYMILCKIMLNSVGRRGSATTASQLFCLPKGPARPGCDACRRLPQTEDVGALLSGKTALKYAGPEVDAMRAVSKAAQHRSLKEFEAALAAHPAGTVPLHVGAHRLQTPWLTLSCGFRHRLACGGAAVLSADPMVKSHLNDLYNSLMEQNLCRIIEPFSRVEIVHIAELIDLPVKQVETKCVRGRRRC